MTDKRLVVTGIVALVFTVPVLVQPLRDGNLHRARPRPNRPAPSTHCVLVELPIGAAFALFAAGLIVYGLFKG
jgi:hypothetical protein